MSQALKQYYSQIRQKLGLLEQRADELNRAAEMMAHSVLAQRNIFVFGASHAGILAEEMSYRAGGLAIINPLFTPALMLNVRPLTLTSAVENVENLGRVLVEQSPLRADDTLLIHSVSGEMRLRSMSRWRQKPAEPGLSPLPAWRRRHESLPATPAVNCW